MGPPDEVSSGGPPNQQKRYKKHIIETASWNLLIERWMITCSLIIWPSFYQGRSANQEGTLKPGEYLPPTCNDFIDIKEVTRTDNSSLRRYINYNSLNQIGRHLIIYGASECTQMVRRDQHELSRLIKTEIQNCLTYRHWTSLYRCTYYLTGWPKFQQLTWTVHGSLQIIRKNSE